MVRDDAFALFDEDHLVRLDIFQCSTRPLGQRIFEELDAFLLLPMPKMDAEIVLREIAAAAADFVDLRMQTLLAGGRCATHLMRAPMPLRLDFVPKWS